jgi:hypothetical protein
LQGYAKKYAWWAWARTLQEAQKLGVKRLKQPRFVSHVTLFGPAETNNLRQVIKEVERIGRRYAPVYFQLGGFDRFRNPYANWLYLDIQPSSDLEKLRNELAQSLCRSERMIYDTCQPHDRGSRYCRLHCSIGKYAPGDRGKFEKLCEYAETKCTLETFRQHNASVFGRLLHIIKKYVFRVGEDDPHISLYILRITVLARGSRIQAEYDLVLRRLLSRREALSRYWWRKTIEKFREWKNAPPATRRRSL